MLAKVNLLSAANATQGLYLYEKIGQLNGHMLSVVRVENRTLDFHVHEQSDELFLVLEGAFQLELADGLLPVAQGEMVIVPKGTLHRPVVGALAKFLMVELDGTLNNENSGALYQA